MDTFFEQYIKEFPLLEIPYRLVIKGKSSVSKAVIESCSVHEICQVIQQFKVHMSEGPNSYVVPQILGMLVKGSAILNNLKVELLEKEAQKILVKFTQVQPAVLVTDPHIEENLPKTPLPREKKPVVSPASSDSTIMSFNLLEIEDHIRISQALSFPQRTRAEIDAITMQDDLLETASPRSLDQPRQQPSFPADLTSFPVENASPHRRTEEAPSSIQVASVHSHHEVADNLQEAVLESEMMQNLQLEDQRAPIVDGPVEIAPNFPAFEAFHISAIPQQPASTAVETDAGRVTRKTRNVIAFVRTNKKKTCKTSKYMAIHDIAKVKELAMLQELMKQADIPLISLPSAPENRLLVSEIYVEDIRRSSHTAIEDTSSLINRAPVNLTSSLTPVLDQNFPFATSTPAELGRLIPAPDSNSGLSLDQEIRIHVPKKLRLDSFAKSTSFVNVPPPIPEEAIIPAESSPTPQSSVAIQSDVAAISASVEGGDENMHNQIILLIQQHKKMTPEQICVGLGKRSIRFNMAVIFNALLSLFKAQQVALYSKDDSNELEFVGEYLH